MTIVPVSLVEARRFVAEHHRHNEPPKGHKFSIGLMDGDRMVGVAVVGRPIARLADDGRTVELLRVTTIGDQNACSMLYGAACRAAFAMGYRRVITYTLPDEPGTSLRAAGFVQDTPASGSDTWGRETRIRELDRPRLFDPPKVPVGRKVRWSRVAA